jgi:hypothetical protein
VPASKPRIVPVIILVSVAAGVAAAAAAPAPIATLIAPGGGTGDAMGWSVAIDGAIAVAGAPFASGAGPLQGSAHVFARGADGAWAEQAALVAPDAAPDDRFGYDVAVSGDTVLVSAYHRTGEAGAVYVFRRDAGGAGAWGHVRTFTGDDTDAGDNFGVSIDLDGDVAVVGAWLDDPDGPDSGSAYVFGRDVGGAEQWGQIAKIRGDDLAHADTFGFSVAVRGDVAVVGSWLDDDGGSESGSAYVFARDAGGPGAWGQTAKLVARDARPFDRFGIAVAIEGGLVAIGTDRTMSGAAGAAYVFRRDPDTSAWIEAARLDQPERTRGERFGIDVAVDSTAVLVGAESGAAATAALFARDAGGAGAWGSAAMLTLAGATGFGHAVAVRGGVAIVGAFAADGAEPGCGAAYVFDVIAPVLGGDCDGNGVSDLVDLFGAGAGADCNDNGIPDACDVGSGTSADRDEDGVPDECAPPRPACPADVDGDGAIGFGDLLEILSSWGPCAEADTDTDTDADAGPGVRRELSPLARVQPGDAHAGISSP